MSDLHSEEVAREIVDSALSVHRELGPGLLENAYEVCLGHELKSRGLRVEHQIAQPIRYNSIELDAGYRLDLVVEDTVIIELKAVESILPVHQAQLLTYLKLSGKTLGFLINFNVALIKSGIKRVVLNHPETKK